MKKTALILMLITILSKLLGFSREIFLSYYYGVSNISDAYLISLTIPMSIFAFVGSAISTGFIPMYSKINEEKGIVEGNKYTNNLLSIFFIIAMLFSVFVFLKPGIFVRIFASGFDNETFLMASEFTRISTFSVYFMILVAVFNALLQINQFYYPPALTGIPLNIVFILSIYYSTITDEKFLAVGIVLAIISQLLILMPYINKIKFKPKWIVDFKDPYILKMIILVAPIILGVSINEINVLVDKTIASTIAIGGISALNYANRLNRFIHGIFIISITSIIYPSMSRAVAKNNIIELKLLLKEAINVGNLLVVPAMIGFVLFSEQIIILLFSRGAFDIYAVSITSDALLFYSIGLIGFGLRDILLRVFYSIQDTKTPMKNAALGMILNIILNIILSRFLGIGGLALATSIAATFTTALLFISLRKKIGPFGMKQISISFLKILFASIIMGVLAKLSFNYLMTSLSQNLSLLIAIGVGVILYFVIIYFMKIEDVDVIVGAIKKKLGR